MDTIYAKNTQSYLGVKALNPPDVFLAKGNPSPHKQKNIGDIWINEEQKTLFVNVANAAGLSNWASMLVTPYVVGSGSEKGNYSSGNYSSIQAAINQAVADGATNLNQLKIAFIAVMPGFYQEHITIPDACIVASYGGSAKYGAIIFGNVTFDCSFGVLSNFIVFTDSSASYTVRVNPNSVLPRLGPQIIYCQIGEGSSATNCLEVFSNSASVNVSLENTRLSTTTTPILTGNNTQVNLAYCQVERGQCISQGSSSHAYNNCSISTQMVLQGTSQMNIFNSDINSGNVECINVAAGARISCINTSLNCSAGSGFVTLGTGNFSAGLCPTPGTAHAVNPLTTLNTIPHL